MLPILARMAKLLKISLGFIKKTEDPTENPLLFVFFANFSARLKQTTHFHL